jgi:hypothetical protein
LKFRGSHLAGENDLQKGGSKKKLRHAHLLQIVNLVKKCELRRMKPRTQLNKNLQLIIANAALSQTMRNQRVCGE